MTIIFSLFMLVCCLVVPGIMLAFGKLWLKKPPKTINSAYGYRTTMSMKNQETWDFAHKYCAGLWWKAGWFVLCISAAAMLPFLGKSVEAVGTAGTVVLFAQCIVLILSIVPVERALKQEFDRDGHRRHRTSSIP